MIVQPRSIKLQVIGEAFTITCYLILTNDGNPDYKSSDIFVES